jgi:hypothetical protein
MKPGVQTPVLPRKKERKKKKRKERRKEDVRGCTIFSISYEDFCCCCCRCFAHTWKWASQKPTQQVFQISRALTAMPNSSLGSNSKWLTYPKALTVGALELFL